MFLGSLNAGYFFLSYPSMAAKKKKKNQKKNQNIQVYMLALFIGSFHTSQFKVYSIDQYIILTCNCNLLCSKNSRKITYSVYLPLYRHLLKFLLLTFVLRENAYVCLGMSQCKMLLAQTQSIKIIL